MDNSFSQKWANINRESATAKADERSLFVSPGEKPRTQRQINLYYYFLFIKDVLERHRGVKEVLEVGSGRGTIALYLATHLGHSATLLDNVPDAMEIAKEDFKKCGKEAKFYIGDALNTNLPDKSFDAVVSIGLAEHFPKEKVEQLFAEQFRLLKPDGVMISLNIPKKFSIQFLNTLFRFFKKMFGRYKESVRKDYYRNELTPHEYKTSAEQAGFSNVSITHVCPFPIFVPITMRTDRRLAAVYNSILRARKMYQRYPFKTNHLIAQAHFLVGEK